MIDRETAIKTVCSVIATFAQKEGVSIEEAIENYQRTFGGYAGTNVEYCYDKRGFMVGSSTFLRSDDDKARSCYFLTWRAIQGIMSDRQKEFKF